MQLIEGYTTTAWNKYPCTFYSLLSYTNGVEIQGGAYCQLIREGNKVKRLTWARQYLTEGSAGFKDVVFTDETSVQLETHCRFACREVSQPARPKLR